jgi:hypothetical protein
VRLTKDRLGRRARHRQGREKTARLVEAIAAMLMVVVDRGHGSCCVFHLSLFSGRGRLVRASPLSFIRLYALIMASPRKLTTGASRHVFA